MSSLSQPQGSDDPRKPDDRELRVAITLATAAAAVLHKANPAALDHCLIGHVSAEPGHIKAIGKLGKTPLLALGMRLGEGTGAALAAGIVKAAALCHSGMATFEQA